MSAWSSLPRARIVHDFVMVNSLHDTEAAKHAVLFAVAAPKSALVR